MTTPPTRPTLRSSSWRYEQGPEPELRSRGSGPSTGGWVVVRQRGSHIRLQKHTPAETLKLVIPAHKPIKRSTLSHRLKDARLTVEALERIL
jgi:predicted RNA binding protein YcfA (HicA-like mRNA interferase family)